MNLTLLTKFVFLAAVSCQLSGCLVDSVPPDSDALASAANQPNNANSPSGDTPTDGSSSDDPPTNPSPFPIPVPPSDTPTTPQPGNEAPSIFGNPPATVVVGNPYQFVPGAADADGDPLTFSVNNLPAWASFESTSGQITGTPTDGDVGSHDNIVVAVNDGMQSVSLASFSIEVMDAASPAPSAGNYVGFGSTTGGHESCQEPFDVYQVTSLSGGGEPGTLRDAVSVGCRHIVFTVGGTINLGDLQISESYITIDGQTAPSPGITLNNVGRLVFEARNSTAVHDVIVNNIRAVGRGGDVETNDLWEIDGSSGAPVYNIVLDHLTMQAASDGAVDMYGNVNDITLSNSLIIDTIKAQHYSQSSALRERISVYKNVYARNNERQPRIRYNTRQVDFVGNVIYGWGWMNSGGAGMNIEVGGQQYSPSANVENNIYHYVAGLNGGPDDGLLIEGGLSGSWHFSNNIWPTGESQGDGASTSNRIDMTHQGADYLLPRETSDITSAGTHFPTTEEMSLLNEIQASLTSQPSDPTPGNDNPPGDDHPPGDDSHEDPPISNPPQDQPPVTPPPPSGDSSVYRGIPNPTTTMGYDPYDVFSIDVNGSGCSYSGTGTASDPHVIDLAGGTFNCGSTGVSLSGRYVILQNGTFNVTSDKGIRGEGCGNCTVRDINVYGNQSGTEFGSLMGLGDNAVFLRTEVAYFGQNTGAGPENDLHGMKACGSNKWILDAHWHHLGGDSVQVGDASRCSGNNIFIGGGSFHDNRENCIDIKDSSNVVASGFECYLPNNKPDEAGVILHDNPVNPQILDGRIFNVNVGIEISGQVNVVVNGNTINANQTGIIVRSANVNISGNTITAPTCVVDQGGVSGPVQSGCN